MSSSPTVLILGAGGRLGAAAAAAFAQAGWQVLAQARRPLPAIAPSVVPVPIAIDDTDALVRRAAGASAVLHAVNPPYPRWAREALPLARAAMDVAQRLGARLLFPGNVYNFGAGMPALLREDTPQQPTTRKGAIRCAIEAQIAARCDDGLRATVLRAGDFFGAGRGSWFDQVIVKSLAAGRLVYPGPTDLPHAWAYVPDLARAFVALAATPGLPAFARFHFGGHTWTGAALCAGIERAAVDRGDVHAGALRTRPLPWRLVRLAGLVVPTMRELAEMAYLWSTPHALDGGALRAAIGGFADTPPDEALRRALDALDPGPRRRVSRATA